MKARHTNEHTNTLASYSYCSTCTMTKQVKTQCITEAVLTLNVENWNYWEHHS
jgi:hypothetical protein